MICVLAHHNDLCVYHMSCRWSRVQYYVIIIITLTAVRVVYYIVVDVYVPTREEHWTPLARGENR